MDTGIAHLPQDGLPLEQRVVRALLEATRQVHSAIPVHEILTQTARIPVPALEMGGAGFPTPAAPALFGKVLTSDAGQILDSLWETLASFSSNSAQAGDMTAVAICHLHSSPQELPSK